MCLGPGRLRTHTPCVYFGGAPAAPCCSQCARIILFSVGVVNISWHMIHHENFKMNNNNINKCWCPCLCEEWIEAVKPYEKKSEKIYVYLVLPLCSTFICVLLNRISVTDEDKISSWILKSTVVTRRRASITDFIQQVKENYFFYCYAFSLMPPSMCFATRVDV